MPHMRPADRLQPYELLPVSRGGSTLDYYNVDAAHRNCNQRRGNRMPGDAKQYQIRRTRLF